MLSVLEYTTAVRPLTLHIGTTSITTARLAQPQNGINRHTEIYPPTRTIERLQLTHAHLKFATQG